MAKISAIEFLMQIRRINEEIRDIDDDIAEMEALIVSVKSPTSDPNKVQTSRNLHSQEDMIVKLVDLKTNCIERRAQKLELKQNVMNIINRIPDRDLYLLIRRRYIDLRSWKEIADEMQYAEQHVREYMHQKALKEVEELINERNW